MNKSELHKLTKILWDWLAIKDEPSKSDLIFLVGGSKLETPKKGLELYQKGFAPYLATSGKTGTFNDSGWNKPIADVFAEFLITKGVNKNKIIVQNRSMNTLEDIVFTMKVIIERKIPHQKIIIVSRPFHQRRSFATFKKQFPYFEYLNVPNDEKLPSENEEEKLKEFAVRCLKEYERLEQYAIKGDLEKQIIPSEIFKTYQKLTTNIPHGMWNGLTHP